jgi:hypothetical protein
VGKSLNISAEKGYASKYVMFPTFDSVLFPHNKHSRSSVQFMLSDLVQFLFFIA